CNMNYSDTERMESYLIALGFKKEESPEKATAIIFNTCSIKQKAEDKVYGKMIGIRRIKQERSNLTVIITGCMVRKSSSRYSSERDKLFSHIQDLDIAIRIEELPKLAGLMREINPNHSLKEIEEESLEDYFKIKASHGSHQSKSQAFIAISNGCDKFCTYCIVPYSRGREKSRHPDDIFKEVEELVENGCKEITLIGQTVNSYGLGLYDRQNKMFSFLEKNSEPTNNKEPFVYLLERLDGLSKKGLQRVRFTSPHPKDMTDQLIEAMSRLKTQMPYIHLPLQSGDNNVLKRMNRSYTIEQYKSIIKKLRKKNPDISISTDIIIGFCGETDEEFKNTCKVFEELKFEHAYLSQYSDRRGTVANRFMKDDIKKELKAKRWFEINEILKKTAMDANKRFIGRTVDVLVESQNKTICLGRDEHFKEIKFKSGRKILGKIVPVKITGIKNITLSGEKIGP
ncbi:tRNA (N6-isopentenyl adenosine(37)-C2)-methylthiotransferase MiaB, partial [Candidatus Peregrinibacteria bacterium]|nr:tRNA (N6-isopentenyl adenosine(37)-C2)-methylthiotransferase MiaB [Candidatus Peregrinibacteria bacterium]